MAWVPELEHAFGSLPLCREVIAAQLTNLHHETFNPKP